MPELPEIETIRRSLDELIGRKITKLKFSRLAPVETSSLASIRHALLQFQITDLQRRGKYLLLHSSGGKNLVFHLGMSGQLRFYPAPPPARAKHTHLELVFSDGSALHYIDARRFGTLSLSGQKDGHDNPFLKKLGPDYLDPRLSCEQFVKICRRHPGLSLKALTLHQGVAAGLGNIYSCESLYRAALDPRRLVRSTSDHELKKLLHAARETLELGIQKGGVSMRDYLDGKGARGVMKEFLQVYDREGQKSLDGKGRVHRIVQNARSTWFVPKIQK
jgi:formamidopyrimidine-DNA glycosylase